MMRVKQRMQVSDISHSVLAFNISDGNSTVEGTSSQCSAWLPTIGVNNLAFISVIAVSPTLRIPAYISRHKVVCHAAQEHGMQHCEYIDRKKLNFLAIDLHCTIAAISWQFTNCFTLVFGNHAIFYQLD